MIRKITLASGLLCIGVAGPIPASAQSQIQPIVIRPDGTHQNCQIYLKTDGSRLHVELPESTAAGVMLPGLTLQPIVENAVRYGVAKRVDGGTVRVEIDRRNGHCSLSVFNQFEPSDGEPKSRSSHRSR